MGKFTTGQGKFTGKNILPEKDGSMTIQQKHYIENQIEAIQLDKNRKREKFSRCTPKEISDLRTLIGVWHGSPKRLDQMWLEE